MTLDSVLKKKRNFKKEKLMKLSWAHTSITTLRFWVLTLILSVKGVHV